MTGNPVGVFDLQDKINNLSTESAYVSDIVEELKRLAKELNGRNSVQNTLYYNGQVHMLLDLTTYLEKCL